MLPDIRFETQKDTLTVFLSGELDHHTAESLRQQIDHMMAITGKKTLLLDFSGIRFMDSAGIGLILGRLRRIEANGGRLELTGLSPKIAQMLRLSGLTKLIHFQEVNV